MTAAQEFQKDGEKRAKLSKLLGNPLLVEAIGIIKQELEPRGDLAVFLGNETICAHRFHQFAGMNYLTDRLKHLTAEFKEAPAPPTPKSLSK